MHKFMLAVYKLMYRLTNDRKWVIRYVDEMDKKIKEEIQQLYASEEERKW